MIKHGIAIKERKTDKTVKFIECSVNNVLKILSGVRINLDSKNYYATECDEE